MFNVSFPNLRSSIGLYESNPQGELAMEALRSSSEDIKREFFYAYKNKESNEKENKEWMTMFMMESGKRNQDQDWLWTNN